MSSPINQYFKENNLFDWSTLQAEAERRGVKIKEHPQHPRLKILGYTDAVQYGKLWDNFNRRCRGLVVDISLGEVVAHPLDKFFNLEEMPETSYKWLVKKKDFFTMEKLDGSFCQAFWDAPTSSWMTTSRSEFTNEYANYALTKGLPPNFGQDEGLRRYSFVFELIDPGFRNVIDYKKKGYTPGLYLLTARDRRTDRLLPQPEVDQLQKTFPELQYFKRPKYYEFQSLDAIMATTKELPFTEEGFVLYYSDGEMCKIKSLDYIKMHRLINNYSEDRVLELLQTGTEKEVLDYLVGVPEEFSKEIYDIIDQAKRSKLEITRQIYGTFAQAPKDSRKVYAQWVNANVPQALRQYMFIVFDNKAIPDSRIYHQFREGILTWRRP